MGGFFVSGDRRMAKARTAPGWRRVFLIALGRSGNVTLAARRAGVDRGTAYQLQKRDAAFAGRWAGAVARAAALASAGGLTAPVVVTAATARDAGDGGAGGLAGLVVRRSKNAGTQVVRAGPGRWSAGVERDFLDALARMACVKRAAAAVGLSTVAVYARRKRDDGLRGRWAAAIGAGEERIGAFLTAAVLAAFDPEVAASGIPAASVSEALAIAKWKGIGGAKAGAGAPELPDFETAKASILLKIEAIERADARKVAGAEAAARLDRPRPNPSPEGAGLIQEGLR